MEFIIYLDVQLFTPFLKYVWIQVRVQQKVLRFNAEVEKDVERRRGWASKLDRVLMSFKFVLWG